MRIHILRIGTTGDHEYIRVRLSETTSPQNVIKNSRPADRIIDDRYHRDREYVRVRLKLLLRRM